MKDRRKGERRSFTWEPYNGTGFFKSGIAIGIEFKRRERRKTIIKAGRRIGVGDRRSEDNYFCYQERRKK